MIKVFRLFKDRDLQHWEDRGDAYGPSVIEKISNPDGDISIREPTSIPSPFARIDLFRTAFKYVVDQNNLDENTIYHKLISDCFDVGEMFFKIDSLGNRAEIKTWDKNTDLDELKNSLNVRHKLYGETLDLFLKQDEEAYNFGSLNKMFFIIYDYKIIGGTSPSTLFFTSANDLSWTKIKFGNDTLFDADLKPLYKRDPEYQKYIYHFFKVNGLSSKMRELYAYLEKNLVMLQNTNKELYNDIKQLERKTAEDLKLELDSSYEAIDTGTPGDNLEILGCWLKKKKIKDRAKVIHENSDFTIKSSKYKGEYTPLVLQNSYALKLIYTDRSVYWQSNTPVKYFDEETNINKRILPGQLDKYPYLTVSDFLQPQIIRLVYPVNKDKYWDGNIRFENGNKTKHFLLPITSKFFEFFDTKDLLEKTMTDGKPMFEMVVYANSVVVYLRIPIKGNTNYITFERTYDNKGFESSGEPDLKNNKGYIVENQIGLAVYPFIKRGNDTDSFYRVMFLDRDITNETKHYRYDLNFYKNEYNAIINKKSTKTRSNKITDKVQTSTSFYILENEFDYIEVKNDNTSGIIIPKFEKITEGTEKFSFAIDFGTTNTHIEYKIGNGTPKPFEITKEDLQFATLFSPDIRNEISTYTNANLMYELIPHEFLPEIISKDSEFRFPLRTALSENINLNLSEPTYSLADFNIPFTYEKYAKKQNAKVSTNLKWSNYTMNDDDRKRVEKFFEKLIFLIRTKVLLNQGSLNSTKLIWFYPSSMMPDRINKLENIWNNLFKKYITDQRSTEKLSESIAPFYYFNRTRGVDASDLPVAAIDIGGGTTDIVIYHQNTPKILTSFRFAANSIFGDAYNGSPEINGFVKKYQNVIEKILTDNNLPDLQAVLNEIKEEQNSADIIAFFFSLENNKTIQERGIPISFNNKLANDDDLKIVFLIFYSSIIYHLARMMKQTKMKPPRYITFSGTGSKIISITDRGKDLNSLQKLTKLIFNKIYDGESVGNLELKQYPEPKEITCKGGLLAETAIDIDEIKNILIGDKQNIIITPNTNLNYGDVNDDILKSVIDEVNSFLDLIFTLNTEFNFTNNFGVNSTNIDSCKEILKEDLMQYLKSGFAIKKKELQGNTNVSIEEPLFFYPLVGTLNKLAFKIVSQNNT
jgi:predicted RNA-binding protein Jag